MNQVIIGVGSNVDPQTNIERSRELLAQHFELVRESCFIQTEPIGLAEQPPFLNGSILIRTDLSQEALRERLRAIEAQLGRRRDGDPYTPRTIDLDIVVWNDQVVDPDVYARDFLKQSIVEICPELCLEEATDSL